MQYLFACLFSPFFFSDSRQRFAETINLVRLCVGELASSYRSYRNLLAPCYVRPGTRTDQCHRPGPPRPAHFAFNIRRFFHRVYREMRGKGRARLKWSLMKSAEAPWPSDCPRPLIDSRVHTYVHTHASSCVLSLHVPQYN